MYDSNRSISKERIISIDLLRGFCVIFLVLHTRYFIEYIGFQGQFWNEIYTQSFSFFILRVIGYPVAPIFLFVAGISIYLFMKRRKFTKKEVFKHLLTRGLFLIFFDIFLISYLWVYSYDYITLQVLSSIGLSFVFFSLFLYISIRILVVFSLLFIIFQEFIQFLIQFLDLGPLLSLFFFKTQFQILETTVFFSYPILISLSILSLGYALGYFMLNNSKEKRKEFFFLLSIFLSSSFVILRFINSYGDPYLWQFGETIFTSLSSFLYLNRTPYSLLYLLFTGGIGFYFLFLFEYVKKVSKYNPLIVFGRSPLFFYLVHIPLIHFYIFFFEDFFSKTVYTFFDLFIFFFLLLMSMYPLCLGYQYIKKKHFSQKGNPYKALMRIVKKNERST